MVGAFFEASWSTVPVIWPVVALIVSPAGSPATLYVNAFPFVALKPCDVEIEMPAWPSV